jgi:hypothetical protein
MHRSFRILAFWGSLVVLLLSSLLVSSGSGRDISPPGWATLGLGAPTVEKASSFAALTPANLTVAPAFSAPSGVVTIGPTRASQSITVIVGLALSDPAGLSGLLSAQYAPGTPEYRHFDSPTTLAQHYGPSTSTVSAARSYFQRFGLSATLSPDHLFLTVSGTAGRIASAFGTEFVDYRAADGRTFVSHPTPATLPGGIAWSGVFGLGNLSSFVPESIGPLSSVVAVGEDASCAGKLGDLAPCDFWQAYNMSALFSNGTNGSGERIAVVDPYSSAETQSNLASDLATFASEEALTVGAVNYVYPVPAPGSLNSSTDTGWGPEDALDLEWARAAAPGATIDMTLSPNAGVGLYEAINWIVAHHAADVISVSWGEPDVGTVNAFDTPCSAGCNASTDGSYALLSPVLEFAAAEGIGVFAASGDCGAADGTSGVATNFPASDPDVTAVGGTALTVDANGDWSSEVAWSGNSSGASAPGCFNQGGSGGGYAPFPRPPWQTGLPTGVTHRGAPDVALDAGSPVAILVHDTWVGVLGTSIATPVWAGIAAIADQYAGRSLGFLDPSLYAIAAGANYSRDFHDIVSGSNGYSTGPGWDPVTGLGSPRVGSLVPALAHPVAFSPGNLAAFVYASPRYGRAPLTVDFAVQATGGSGTYPLEGVSFGNGNASFASYGNTSSTFETPGVYSVQAYVGDSSANYAVSPPLAVVVGGGNALGVNLTASTETPGVDASVHFSVNVTGGSPPYTFDYSFGDGTYLNGSSAGTATHEYGAAGSFCPAVVVSDSATPENGAASSRVAIGVGGASLPDCRNDTVPLSITPVPSPGVRDAPADFPDLFTISGGPSYSGGPPASLQFSSSDPYLSACECAIFRHPGAYSVVGYANDSESEQVNASTNVTVAPPLVGAFSASPTFGPAPLTVVFHVNASGGFGASAADTVWTFGNGQQAQGVSASETYDAPGFYLAIGRLSDLGQGNTSEAFLIDVGPTGAAASPDPPYLVATVSPVADVALGASVNFSARLVFLNGSEDPALFQWFISPEIGAYRPAFNWTNPFGEWVTTLTAGLSATISASGQRLNATLTFPSFDGGAASGGYERAVDGLEFTPFTHLLVLAAGATWTAAPTHLVGPGTLSVSWAFGDGTTEVNRSASHIFSEGLYTVVATASDSWGDRATSEFAVAVSTVPTLNATLSATVGSPPLRVSFSASALGGCGPPYWYAWSFGDGGNATGANGTHTFASVGHYLVSVDVTDAFGQVVEKNWTVTVEPSFAGVGVGILVVSVAVGVAAAVSVNRTRRRKSGAATPSAPPSP